MSARREEIVAAARSWIGTPYRHQAALKGVGCDCLGLLRGLFQELTGGEAERVPAYTPDWAEAQGRETLAEGLARHLVAIEPAAAGAGDVVLFRWKQGLPAKHAAVLTGALPLALRGPFALHSERGQRGGSPDGEGALQDEGKVGSRPLAHPTMIHAVQGCPVAEVPVTDWWRRRVAFALRFPALST